jgi:DNA replication initiation complex subunit (GINS family)
MQVSYDEIRRIYRAEKNNSRLAEADEDFFDSLAEFVKQQKEQYLKSLKTLSTAKARDFTNLKKMIEEIFSLREKKLLNLALVSSRTGDPVEGKMATQEKRTFKELLQVLNRHKTFLEEIFSIEQETTEKTADLNKISMLDDVPSFVGADMKEYGPFEKGSAVEVPEKIALLLLARKLAQKAE